MQGQATGAAVAVKVYRSGLTDVHLSPPESPPKQIDQWKRYSKGVPDRIRTNQRHIMVEEEPYGEDICSTVASAQHNSQHNSLDPLRFMPAKELMQI